jgi:CubicO group peptidase (beta-lactamase class C family)
MMRSSGVRAFCMAVMAGFSSAGAWADASDDASKRQVEQLFKQYTGNEAPGCAVGVFDGGKVKFARGYGAADISNGRPLTPSTIFYAASVSKQFTALAAALLVEQGKLRFEDDVRRWIPELPDYGTPITVGMLVHHTSGIRDFLSLFDLAGFNDYDRLDVPTTLRMITRQRGINFQPGTKYSYSNGGYFLLAETVARASGMPFHEFARRNIFEPLGMRRAFFRHGPNPAGTNAAHGYVPRDGGGFDTADGYPAVSGSGGLMVSLDDLVKYDQDFHVGHEVWSPRVRELMLTPGTFTNGEQVMTDRDGLYDAGGLSVGQLRGQQWVAHSGGAKGFRNLYVLLPDLKFSVAAFCNRGDVNPHSLVQGAIDAYRGGALSGAWPPESKRGDEDQSNAAAAAPDLVDAMVGRFRSDELDAEYAFARVESGLRLSISSPYSANPHVQVFPKPVQPAADLLSLDSDDLRFERTAGGGVAAFTTTGESLGGIRFVRLP